MSRIFRMGLLALLAGAALPLAADSRDPDEAIEYRQSIYKAIRWHMEPMTAMVRGEMEYDAVSLTRHAQNVHALSQMLLEGFVPGSHQGNTAARPEIWDKWEVFESRMENLGEQSQALVIASTSGDLRGNIRPAFAQLTQACRACHDEFRMRR